MRGDGYNGNGNIIYSTKSKKLADDVQEIILKLGDTANIYTRTKGKFSWYNVNTSKTKLYRFNGSKWIEVDKNVSDSFAYNDGYIDHLIAKIGNGEYDPELLNDSERDQIEERLKNQDL